MRRSWLLRGFVVSALLASAPAASGQGPIDDAAVPSDAAAMVPTQAAPPGAPTTTPTPTATSTSTSERPVRGPAVRERGGRRSRGASTASGVLMLVMLIGFMVAYVVKKLRR